MTDDDRLAALFRAAASDAGAPPPGFDHDDVVSASHRITARRRSAVRGAALGALVAAGIGIAVVVPDYSVDAPSTAAAPYVSSDGAGDREAAPPVGGPAAAVPGGEAADAQALDAAAPPGGPPLGPGTGECADRQDPAMRAFVEQVLPEVVGAPEAAVTTDCRPGGERGVNLEVTDAGAAGLLTVAYLPPGAPVRPAATPDASTASAATASGGTVTVSSRPAKPGGPIPFEARLDVAAAFLAPRL